MEKNDKNSSSKNRLSFDFFVKALLLVLCAVVVVQLIVVAKGFESVKERLNYLELKEKSSSRSSFESEKHDPRTRRAKRSVDEAEFKKALAKLRNLEARMNQSYRLVGRQPTFLLRGPPGHPGTSGSAGTPGIGRPGPSGTPGTPGTTGSPGKNGRDGRDGAQGTRGNPGVPGERGAEGPAGPKGMQGESGKVGVNYIRWGRKTCPNTGATLVYEGYVGGSHYSHSGGASNYICLTRDPTYEKHQSGTQADRSLIYGAEYQTYSDGIYPSSLFEHDVPCAVCHVTKRATQMMIPGRNLCPAGWTREYKGYLMAEKYDHHRTTYTCVDENPDYTRGTHANLNGALLYFVEGRCGSLPCKPYINGQELTCAVCTR